MRPLPDKMRFNMDRPKLEAYITIVERLLSFYADEYIEDQEEKLVRLMLERIKIALKRAELKLSNNFSVTLPVEQALAWHIALKNYGGAMQQTWLSHYYNTIMLQIDPVLA